MISIYLFYLIIFFFEIDWSLGFKLSVFQPFKMFVTMISFILIVVSEILLWLSLKGITTGTACAVWTGIGAA
jgi:multidrug transporter EmrE-like cation transporter